MVCDLKETDPADWDKDKRPETSPENVIYELHVKEFSWEASGGFKKENRGKYRALPKSIPHFTETVCILPDLII